MAVSDASDFWTNLEKLQQRLLLEKRSYEVRKYCDSSESMPTAERSGRRSSQSQSDRRKEVLEKVEGVIQGLVTSLGNSEAPALSYPSRTTWQNVRFREGYGLEVVPDGTKTSVRFDCIKSVKKFSLMIKVLSMIYDLIQSNSFSTKRDIYYKDPKAFGRQSCVDDIVDNISCMLAIPRWNLHVLATSKGCIAGDLQFVDAHGNYVDCNETNTGILVPSLVEGISSVTSRAKFVLVVEKDASFQALLDGALCRKLAPCIVITGKGCPDVNTRLMLRLLSDRLQLPTLALVDADPHGIEIMAIYKYGSKSMAFEGAKLAVPSVRWLGVLPSDIQRLQIPTEALLPLTSSDLTKANEMLKRPYISAEPMWRSEIESLLRSGVKAEIQCLSAVSSTFLCDVYLPNKIRFGGWI